VARTASRVLPSGEFLDALRQCCKAAWFQLTGGLPIVQRR
jgi:hypothetical protein